VCVCVCVERQYRPVKMSARRKNPTLFRTVEMLVTWLGRWEKIKRRRVSGMSAVGSLQALGVGSCCVECEGQK